MMTTHLQATLGLVLFLAAPAAADDFFWAAPVGGLWFDPDRWLDADSAPGADDHVFIATPGEYTVVVSSFTIVSSSARALSLLEPDAELYIGLGDCPLSGCTTGFALRLTGPLSNDGQITIPAWDPATPSSTLTLEDGELGAPCPISGSGVIMLTGGAILGAANHLAGHTITGAGSVSLHHNDGAIHSSPQISPLGFPQATLEVTADLNTGPICAGAGTFLSLDLGVNTGALDCSPESSLALRATLNASSLLGHPDSTLILNECHNTPDVVIDPRGGALNVEGPLTGGVLRNTDGGDAKIPNFANVVLEGEFCAEGDFPPPGFTNNARLTLTADVQILPGTAINGVGEIFLVDRDTPPILSVWAIPPGRVHIPASQLISGFGRLRGEFDIAADISPGNDDQPGDISIWMPPVLHDTTALLIDAFAHDRFDRVPYFNNNDPIALDGFVDIRFRDFTPNLGAEFPFLPVYFGHSGAFDALATQDLDPSLDAVLIYREDAVVARIVSADCPADLAPPAGVLDFSDVLAFLDAYSAMEPHADLAPPQGVFDFSDVLSYINAFADACP